MTHEEFKNYEQYLETNKDSFNTKIFGSYLRYLDRYLHNKEIIVDGMTWEERMKLEPMSKNVYLYG